MSFHSAGAHCVLKRRVAIWTALASVFSAPSALHAQTAPVATLPASRPRDRVRAAILLVAATPEYLVQK